MKIKTRRPKKIYDPDLRERYKEWLKYRDENRAKVLQDNVLENRYLQKKTTSLWLAAG